MVIENDLKIGLVGSIADEPIFYCSVKILRQKNRFQGRKFMFLCLSVETKKYVILYSLSKWEFVKIANLEEFSEDKGWGFI